MGSVFLRMRKDSGAKKWYVEYSYGGKRIRKLAKGARNKSEAKAYLREIERQVERGEFFQRKRKQILFETFAKQYFNWSKLNKLSWKSDETSLKHLVPFFKGMLLHQITPMLIEDYKRRRKKMVSGSTVNRELACLRHLLNKAADADYMVENPFRKVRFFPENNQKERILNDDEISRLLKFSRDPLKSIVLFALHAGMRRGEILGLKWENVHLEKGFIHVEKTKSGRTRKVPINSLLEKVLAEQIEKRKNDEYVFWNERTRKPFLDVKKSFKNACKKAGIENLRFHDLRHTFATRLIESGVDIVTVSELLGHSSIKMTMRYSHPTPTHKRNAVESLVWTNGNDDAEVLTGLLTERDSRRA